MKCTFCKKEIEPGTGKMYVTKDGKRSMYCTSKCEKNHLKLGRKPYKTKWVKSD